MTNNSVGDDVADPGPRVRGTALPTRRGTGAAGNAREDGATGRRRPGLAGFTIVEMMVTTAVLAIVSAIIVGPMVHGLRFVQQEASVLAMDRSADQAMNQITDTLRSAILPVATYKASKVPVKTEEIATFQDLLNSRLGFGANGMDWHKVLAAGSDFVVFTVPVDFGGDGDTLDTNLVPELGVILPSGEEIAAGEYVIDPLEKTNVLDTSVSGCLHPYLASLSPTWFGSDVYDPTGTPFDDSQSRYAEDFSFPRGHLGYGVIRFVPYRSGNPADNAFVLLEEKNLGTVGFDLNDDGTLDDSFLLGSLEILYATGIDGATMPRRVSGPMVLLQTNRDSPSWTPLFQLVRYKVTDSDAPNSSNFSGEAVKEGGFALLIRFHMYDRLTQDGVANLAFQRALPFIVRQYQTLIKLRNLSNNTKVEQ